MERKATASLEGLRKDEAGRAAGGRFHFGWRLGLKGSLFAVAAFALVGALSFTAIREVTTIGGGAAPAASRSAPVPPRPAWTRAEEKYIQALWPIHGDVERSAERVSLGKIFYKVGDLGKADLKARVDAALASYQQAEARISALQPPQSLAREHEQYLAAVRLFQESAVELEKLFEDGSDEHLLAAYPASQQGSDKIREVGVKFWQDEFPAH